MLTRTLFGLASLGVATGALLLATPAYASGFEERQAEVRIGDLDLDTERGTAILDRRVRSAARQICGAVPGRDLRMQNLAMACHQQVFADAETGVATAMAARGSRSRLALRSR